MPRYRDSVSKHFMIRRRDLLAGATVFAVAPSHALTSLAQANTGSEPADLPYPAFSHTTIARMRSPADVVAVGAGLIAPEAMDDNPYGASALKLNFSGRVGTLSPRFPLSVPLDVRRGAIRWTFKPISGIRNRQSSLSKWSIHLFSSGSPANPPRDYHQVSTANAVNQQSTGSLSNAGRWQSIAAPTSSFKAAGLGSDLSAVTWARLELRASSEAVIGVGDLDFVPNPRAKGALIFRFDDAYVSAYTIAYPLLAAVKTGGFLAPGAVASASGINAPGRLSTRQVLEMLKAGWQFGSQCYSTENSNTVDAWTSAERDKEYKDTRAYARTLGRYRDSADGTYYSGVAMNDMMAFPELTSNFRTIQNFRNGNPVNPPLEFGECFPFADPKNVICLNHGGNGGTGSDIKKFTGYALDQIRASKGVLILGHHNELAANHHVLDAFNFAIDYATSLYPDDLEITTPRKLLAPFNNDSLAD